jgi:hypothetical protein
VGENGRYNYSLVDNRTGEIVDEGDCFYRKIKKKTGERVTKAVKKIEPMGKEEKQMGRVIQTYSQFNREELPLLAQVLTGAELKLMTALGYRVGQYDQCIKHPNGKIIQIPAMILLSQLSEKSVIEALRGLIRRNIVYRGFVGKGYQYFLCPWVASVGATINATLTTMFKDYVVLSAGGKTWGQLIDEEEARARQYVKRWDGGSN